MEKKKILIIGDEEDIAKAIFVSLHAKGYDVAAAFDAMQGTQLAHKMRPDLIILDLLMPAAGGAGVLSNIKKSMDTRDIPIISYSTLADETHKCEVMEKGTMAHFDKTHSLAEIADFIRQYFEDRDKKASGGASG